MTIRFMRSGVDVTSTAFVGEDGTTYLAGYPAGCTDEELQALGIVKVAEVPPPPPPPPGPVVPPFITARQAKSALLLSGWLGGTDEEVEANGYLLFDSMQEPNRSLGRIAWRESNDFQRDNPMVVEMISVLNKTKEQGDELFILGATL